MRRLHSLHSSVTRTRFPRAMSHPRTAGQTRVNFLFFPVSPCPGLNWRPRPYQGRALPTELHGRYDLRRSGRRDSNPRRLAWKARALPTELHPQEETEPNQTWRGKDSNLRSVDAADLQSAPFGHSGTPPVFSSVFQELAAGIEPATC